MQRESEKHGPVRGEYARPGTEDLSRAEDRSGRDRAAEPERPRTPPRGMSPAEVARRAELTRHLPPGEFPADRAHLLSRLRTRHAPDSVIDAVSGLPEGTEFHTLGEVVRAIGLRTER